MFLKRMIPFLVLSFLVVAGCSREDGYKSPPGPDVVASFDGGVITKAQVAAKFESLMPCCKGRYQGDEGRRTLLKEMVLPVVISRAIKQKKIDLRGNIRKELGNLSDELNMAFLHIKFHEQILGANEKYKDIKEMYEYQKKVLAGAPLSERYDRLVRLHQEIHPQIAKDVEKVSEDYVRKLRREASITKDYDELNVKVTAEELKDFYQKHKEGLHGDEYRFPERVRIQEILIDADKNIEDCPACLKERAESALLELRSGAEFRTVAQKYSADTLEPMKPKWVVRGNREKDFEETLFSLDIGEISLVPEKEGAFYIVKFLEKQPERFKSYHEIKDSLTREYRWQKGEDYLKQNRDRILFTINGKPYTIGEFLNAYQRENPPHQCHHMEGMDHQENMKKTQQLCDFAHNDIEDQKKLVDRMIDGELIVEDTYNQMIHVEHQKEIEFVTMASIYPIFHREEMEKLIRITDEMVDEYYQKEKKAYMYPAKAKLSMILIKGGETEEDKNRAFEKATKVYKELKPSLFSFKKGKDFAEVARKYSEDDETAAKGGRIEVDVYECRNAIDYMLFHGFHKEIFALNSGEISDVFEFENNYYIMQTREMEKRKQKVFEEIREQVKKDLIAKEHQKVMVGWEDNLLKSAGFAIYDQALEEALAEVPSEEQHKSRGT